MSDADRTGGVDPVEAKLCCATTYSSDLVESLLGASYHPGGLTLTRRLLTAAALRPGEHLLDIASGIGTTGFIAAEEFAALADGVDLSQANVASANTAAHRRGLTDRVTFRMGDAEALPLPDATYDVVVCECALCTFPDKQTAVSEMTRMLRPGGRIGLTDVTADRSRLPTELTSLFAWVACIADARPRQEYVALLENAGLRIDVVESHDKALVRMIDQIEARLTLLRMTTPDTAAEFGLDSSAVTGVLAAAREATATGSLGYTLIVAHAPQALSRAY
jgi:arsenite methyltransferase